MDVSKKVPASEVIVHPLVLLSVADHYNRVAKDARNKRVVGVLLGSRIGNSVDVCNSFAVPFEEDLTNPKVWFLDHNFLESMFWMFKKVNCELHYYKLLYFNAYAYLIAWIVARETVVGFYSTGPKIKENDIKV